MRAAFGPTLLALCLACKGPRPEKADALLRRLPCFAPESAAVAYGEIVISPETEDASGVQFSFQPAGERLEGFVRDARGEIPPRRPLQDVRFDAQTDSLTFWYASAESDTRYEYRYHVTCRELMGTAQLFVTADDTGLRVTDTLHRAVLINSP